MSASNRPRPRVVERRPGLAEHGRSPRFVIDPDDTLERPPASWPRTTPPPRSTVPSPYWGPPSPLASRERAPASAGRGRFAPMPSVIDADASTIALAAVEAPRSTPTPLPPRPVAPRVDPPRRAHPLAANASPAAAPVAGGGLFREAAVRAYLRGEAGVAVLRVAPVWTALLFRVAAFSTFVVVLAACVTRIDLTARAAGILRTEGGVQVLAAPGPARVAEVYAKPGDTVRPGDVLLAFDLATLEASVVEAEQRLALARSNLEEYEQKQLAHKEEERRLLTARLKLLAHRKSSQRDTVARLERRAARLRALLAEGLAPAQELEETEEQMAAARRSAIGLDDDVIQTRAELSRLSADTEGERHRRKGELDAALAHRRGLELTAAQSTVKATKAGRVEAVVVQPGDVVAAGAPVAKLVPADAPLTVVCFLAERDRAFLETGSLVRVELEQLPSTEFGALRGRVTRIGQDLASSFEVRAALGDKADVEGPVYRVDVELVDDAQGRALGPYLRPSSLLSVRFALRTRRVITLLLEPLRKVLS